MKLLKSFSVYHSLPSIHNKTVAERETKYSQTFVQQSPVGNGIKVTVIYTYWQLHTLSQKCTIFTSPCLINAREFYILQSFDIL